MQKWNKIKGENMNNQEKIKIFQESCQRLLNREVAELSKKIDTEIEQQIKDELQEYQEKEEFAYQKKLEKLEKDYNKQIYSLEMESKKDVLNQKKLIHKDLNKEVIQILKDFTKAPEYESFLMKRIEESIQKLENTNHAILGIVKQDEERYGNKIREKYQIEIKIIDDKFIGGCLLEDEMAGLAIDDTIQNSIDEKLQNNELR